MRGLDLISHDAALDVTDGRTAVVGVDSKRAMEAINAAVGPLWLRPFLMDLHNLGVIGKLLLHKVDGDIPAMELAHHVAVQTRREGLSQPHGRGGIRKILFKYLKRLGRHIFRLKGIFRHLKVCLIK